MEVGVAFVSWFDCVVRVMMTVDACMFVTDKYTISLPTIVSSADHYAENWR